MRLADRLPLAGCLFAALLGLGLAEALLGAPRTQPDIARGEAVFALECAGCHGSSLSRPDFDERGWKLATTPQRVAATALGRSGGHPQALADEASAWHVSAYLWTRSTSAPEVQRGLALARAAEARLEGEGLFALLGRLGDINALRDAGWVLSQPPDEIERRLAALAGDGYAELPPLDRVALTEYIYASYFAWPADWQAGAEAR